MDSQKSIEILILIREEYNDKIIYSPLAYMHQECVDRKAAIQEGINSLKENTK